MKIKLALLFLLPLQIAYGAEGDEFPIEVNGFFDGGTMYVKDLKQKGREGVTMCIDRRAQSKTREKIYIGGEHPTDPEARIPTPDELKLKLDVLEAMMKKFFGDNVYAQIFAADTKEKIELVKMQNPQFERSKILDAAFACHLIKIGRQSNLKTQQSRDAPTGHKHLNFISPFLHPRRWAHI